MELLCAPASGGGALPFFGLMRLPPVPGFADAMPRLMTVVALMRSSTRSRLLIAAKCRGNLLLWLTRAGGGQPASLRTSVLGCRQD